MAARPTPLKGSTETLAASKARHSRTSSPAPARFTAAVASVRRPSASRSACGKKAAQSPVRVLASRASTSWLFANSSNNGQFKPACATSRIRRRIDSGTTALAHQMRNWASRKRTGATHPAVKAESAAPSLACPNDNPTLGPPSKQLSQSANGFSQWTHIKAPDSLKLTRSRIEQPDLQNLRMPGMIVSAEQSIPDRQFDPEILIPMARIDTVMDLMMSWTHEQPIEHRTIGEPDMRMAQMSTQ